MTTVEPVGALLNGHGVADPAPQLPHMIDATTLATHLGVTVRTIRRKVADGEIPYIRLGGIIRFDLAEITAWIDAARVGRDTSRCAACQNRTRP